MSPPFDPAPHRDRPRYRPQGELEFGGLDLPDEHLRAIGRVVVAFATLEWLVYVAAWEMIGVEQGMGQILTVERSFRQMLDLLSAVHLYQLPGSATHERLKGIITRAEEAEAIRNSVVHSAWTINQQRTRVKRLKITAKRGGHRWTSVVITPDELDSWADKTQLVSEDLVEFVVDYTGGDRSALLNQLRQKNL
jgi:hypothetical protein